jgi:hypothetical protein
MDISGPPAYVQALQNLETVIYLLAEEAQAV